MITELGAHPNLAKVFWILQMRQSAGNPSMRQVIILVLFFLFPIFNFCSVLCWISQRHTHLHTLIKIWKNSLIFIQFSNASHKQCLKAPEEIFFKIEK